MEKKVEILQKIQDENIAWSIYIVLILLSFYSNSIEKKYILFDDVKAKEEYRKLNIFIFAVALLVYLYFFEDSLRDVKNLKETDSSTTKFFNEANLIAATLILIGGCILLYIAIFDKDLETEIALT